MNLRIGHGYDVHRLVLGRKLILGGVAIPFDRGLLGHSDADVLVHAVIDALFGAAALGDIGTHFPDSDPAFREASSLYLLGRTMEILTKNGYAVVNVDTTVIAQEPKLKPYIFRMRQNISRYLGIPSERVNVKATTEEGLGFTGLGDGMAAHATVLLEVLG